MARLGDIFYFLGQIFFPQWTTREEDGTPTRWQKLLTIMLLFLYSRSGTGAIFSVVLHVFILTILSLYMISQTGGFNGIAVLGGFNVPGAESPIPLPPSVEDSTGNDTLDGSSAESIENIPDTDTSLEQTVDTQSPASPNTSNNESAPASVPSFTDAEIISGRAIGGFSTGGGFENRSDAGRRGIMGTGNGGGGGGQASEDAVEAGLNWLAHHQQTDGGWSLYFSDSCGQCSHSGTGRQPRRTAATALALLSFLGAGYTHQIESTHRKIVDDGLWFLVRDPNGGIDAIPLRNDELRMYSHGLASIALCEAFAMSRGQDTQSQLGLAAQKSLWTIETAQDYNGGGWRYRPNQSPGDTSVFAWQLMALKSGKIGGLHVSQSTLYAAQSFLDSVALEGGRRYQYLPLDWQSTLGYDQTIGPDSPQACTAMGLLMRMYLGWKPGDVFLDDGIKQIAQWGPFLQEGQCNLYYIYYATLALHHYGGEYWEPWNNEVREFLIRTQSRQGCEAGSWFFPDHHCDSGGRLLNTALAIMILETPYRYMPLYREIRQR